MAVALRRPGRIVDYYVDPTPADITSPTINDPEAAHALPCLRHEIELPPVPVYETRETRRARRTAFLVSVFVSGVLFDVLVRVIVGR